MLTETKIDRGVQAIENWRREREDLAKLSSEDLLNKLFKCGVEVGEHAQELPHERSYNADTSGLQASVIQSILKERLAAYRLPQVGDIATTTALPGFLQGKATGVVILSVDGMRVLVVSHHVTQTECCEWVPASSLTFIRSGNDQPDPGSRQE
jgi:hypothetical protein